VYYRQDVACKCSQGRLGISFDRLHVPLLSCSRNQNLEEFIQGGQHISLQVFGSHTLIETPFTIPGKWRGIGSYDSIQLLCLNSAASSKEICRETASVELVAMINES